MKPGLLLLFLCLLICRWHRAHHKALQYFSIPLKSSSYGGRSAKSVSLGSVLSSGMESSIKGHQPLAQIPLKMQAISSASLASRVKAVSWEISNLF